MGWDLPGWDGGVGWDWVVGMGWSGNGVGWSGEGMDRGSR